jgi:hypothetical protein
MLARQHMTIQLAAACENIQEALEEGLAYLLNVRMEAIVRTAGKLLLDYTA